jgi:hypothetical protein
VIEPEDAPSEEQSRGADLLGDVLIRQPADPADLASRPLFPPTEEDEPAVGAAPVAAQTSPRIRALFVDALLCLLLSGGSLLAAGSAALAVPALGSWLWCGLFAILLSFFLSVPTLALFGKTPGMALADLTAEGSRGDRPTLSEAGLRWLGTVVTVAGAGIPLLTVLFDSSHRTLADLLSRRPLRSLLMEPAR